jgi:hypothetical protein
MDASSQPVMQAHDPSDDPFGDMSMEFDANQLPSPADFGSGVVSAVNETSPKEAEDATPVEPAASDPKEEAKEDAPKEDS